MVDGLGVRVNVSNMPSWVGWEEGGYPGICTLYPGGHTTPGICSTTPPWIHLSVSARWARPCYTGWGWYGVQALTHHVAERNIPESGVTVVPRYRHPRYFREG